MTRDIETALAPGGALHALAAYRQFVNYADDKRPLNPATGGPASSTDPATWGSAAEAMATGRPVGFVLTDDDPFFFLDIDKAYDGTAWSPVAAELSAALGACALEVSKSGTGLHLFGTGTLPAHSNRNGEHRLELYTTQRYAALTGSGARGDASADATDAMRGIVARYFPPRAAAAAGVAGDGPREDWRGPADDDDLIRRARRSKSTAALFGGKASFEDLWLADAAVLAQHFPPNDSGTEAWDGSRADEALASHLAFWTGCDGPRIERLMHRSGLVRDKWERGDYMARTIAKACGPDRAVCQDKQTEAETANGAPAGDRAVVLGPTDPRPPLPDISGGYLPPAGQGGAAMAAFFHGMTYVADRHAVLMPDGTFQAPEPFNATHAGPLFRMGGPDDKVTKKAFEAFTGSHYLAARKVSGDAFDPRHPFGALLDRDGVSVVNTYRDRRGERRKGDPSPFLNHYAKLFPDERDRRILYSWMAACVQHVGVKLPWAVVLQAGAEGIGKSALGEYLAYALGGPDRHYYHELDGDEISATHTGWKLEKLFMLSNEISRHHVTGPARSRLYSLIDAKRQNIRAMRQDAVTQEVFFNIMFTTNHKGVFDIKEGTRRLAVFHSALQDDAAKVAAGITGEYLAELRRWAADGGLAIVHEWLATYPIDPEFDPTGAALFAPHTSSFEDAKESSRSAASDVLLEAIDEERPGFAGGWVSLAAVRKLLRFERKGGPASKLDEAVRACGFVPVEGAGIGGRTNNPVHPDGVRTRLYARVGHAAHSMQTAADIAAAYSEAQQALPFGK